MQAENVYGFFLFSFGMNIFSVPYMIVVWLKKVYSLSLNSINLFEATYKLHHSSKNFKVWKKKSAITI